MSKYRLLNEGGYDFLKGIKFPVEVIGKEEDGIVTVAVEELLAVGAESWIADWCIDRGVESFKFPVYWVCEEIEPQESYVREYTLIGSSEEYAFMRGVDFPVRVRGSLPRASGNVVYVLVSSTEIEKIGGRNPDPLGRKVWIPFILGKEIKFKFN